MTIRNVIAIYCNKYSKLLEGLENQLMLNNNEIVGDAKVAKKAEDIGDGGDTRNTGETGKIRDARNTKDARVKKAGRGNKKRKQENIEIGNNIRVDNGNYKPGKIGYNIIGGGIDVSRIPDVVKIGKDNVRDNAGNWDNQHTIVKNRKYFNI